VFLIRGEKRLPVVGGCRCNGCCDSDPAVG
jgi:hypothetical protein